MKRWFFLILLLASLVTAYGNAVSKDVEHDMKPVAADIGEWYDHLVQPDIGSPCCGDGDAYYADKTEGCTPDDVVWLNRWTSQYDTPKRCWLVAIVTDTRPDVIHISSERCEKDEAKHLAGCVVKRLHIPVGTRIPVPFRKRRSRAAYITNPNPTDHNVVFVYGGVDERHAICYEPGGRF